MSFEPTATTPMSTTAGKTSLARGSVAAMRTGTLPSGVTSSTVSSCFSFSNGLNVTGTASVVPADILIRFGEFFEAI